MNTDDLNERYRTAQMSRLPDYRDGFEAGRQSMRWWLVASMIVSFCWGIVIARAIL